MYGLATHLRIYPIIYALPLVMFIGGNGDLPRGSGAGDAPAAPVPGAASPSLVGVLTRFGSQGGAVQVEPIKPTLKAP